jgi:hypothetical protein
VTQERLRAILAPVTGEKKDIETIAADMAWKYGGLVNSHIDHRDFASWSQSIGQSLKSSTAHAAIFAGAIPATLMNWVGVSPDAWYSIYDWKNTTDKKYNESYQTTTTQGIVSGAVGVVPQILLPFGTAATLARVGMSAKASMTAMSMMAAAQTSVSSMVERTQKLEGKPTQASDVAWASVNGTVSGVLSWLVGAAGVATPLGIGGKQTVSAAAKDVLSEGVEGVSDVTTSAGAEGRMVSAGEAAVEFVGGVAAAGVINVGTTLATGGFAIPDAAKNIVSSTIKAAKAVEHAEGLAQLGVSTAALPTRSKTVVAELVKTALGSSDSKLYVTREDWESLWVSRNTNPTDALATVKDGKVVGDFVEMSAAEMIATFNVDQQVYTDLLGVVRMSPDAAPLNGADKTLTDARKELKKILDAPPKLVSGVEDDSILISQDVAAQITALPNLPKNAQMAAQGQSLLTASVFRSLADDLNLQLETKFTPNELYTKYRPLVVLDGGKDRRGGFDAKKREIALLGKGRTRFDTASDASTVAHEFGHYFLDIRSAVANDLGATGVTTTQNDDFVSWIRENAAQVVDGYKKRKPDANLAGLTVEKVIQNADKLHSMREKDADFHTWAAIHEYFARGWEEYLREGKAPTSALRKVFQQFSRWISKVYSLFGESANAVNPAVMDVTLTPGARQFMQRLAAAERSVQEHVDPTLQQINGFLIEARKGLPIPPERLAKLEAATLASREIIVEQTLAKIQSDHKQEDAAVRKKAQDDLLQEWADNRDPELARAWDMREKMLTEKPLSREDAVKLLSPENAAALDMTGEIQPGGQPINAAAKEYGYQDGSALLDALVGTPQEAVMQQRWLDQRMEEMFGPQPSDAEYRAAAINSLIDDHLGMLFAQERDILMDAYSKDAKGRDTAKALKVGPVVRAMMAANAAIESSRTSLRNLRTPAAYNEMILATHKRSVEAFAAGDLSKTYALTESMTELVERSKADKEARAKGQAALKVIESFQSKPGKINAVVDEMRKGAAITVHLSDGTTDYVQTMAQAEAHMVLDPAARISTAVDDVAAIMDQFSKLSPMDESYVTLEQFAGGLTAIQNEVKNVNKLLSDANGKEMSQVAGTLIQSISDNAPAKPFADEGVVGKINTAIGWVVGSAWRLSSFSKTLDGGADGPANELMQRVQRQSAKARVGADKLTKDYLALAKTTGTLDHRYMLINEANKPRLVRQGSNLMLSTNDRRALVAHWGTESGRIRALQHLKLEQPGAATAALEADMQSIIDGMTDADIAYVKGVWAQNESLKPEIEDTYRSAVEAPPIWLLPTPFVVKRADGSIIDMGGGYYTVKYRNDIPRNASATWEYLMGAEAIQNDQKVRPSESFSKSRTAADPGRKLNLSPDVHVRHLQETMDVVHKLALAKDVARLLHPTRGVKNTVALKYGIGFANAYDSAIRFSITGAPPPSGGWEQAAQHIRAGATISTLAFNAATILKQPLGFAGVLASPQVNKGRLVGSIKMAMQHPQDSLAFVISRTHMKDMFTVGANQSADVAHILTGNPALMGIKKWSMSPIAVMQMFVNVPTWMAAYDTALSRGATEAKAVDLADQTVRDTQGTGEDTEFTAMHQNQYTRLLTTFGGYLITQMNSLSVPVMTIAKNPMSWNPAAAAAWKQLGAQMFFTILMSAMLSEAVDAWLKGGTFGPEDKASAEEWMGYGAKTAARSVLATNPLSRYLADSVERNTLLAPAGLRPVESSVRAVAGAYNVATNPNSQQEWSDVAAHAIRAVGGFTMMPTGPLARLFTGEDWQQMLFGKPAK